MVSPRPAQMPGDFEIVQSAETLPSPPSNTPNKEVDSSDEKSEHTIDNGEPHHRSSDPVDNRPMPSSTMQSLAKVLLLAHLPFMMAGGVSKAVLKQRRRLMESCDADEALNVATSQAENVLQRCRDDLKWIETEMPSWMESKFARSGHFGYSHRSRGARREGEGKSTNKDSTVTRDKCSSCDCSRPRSRRRRGGMLGKGLMLLVAIMALHWILFLPLAIMRLVVGVKLPLWLVIGGVWMVVSKRRRHRRRGHHGGHNSSDDGSDSGVE